MSVAWRCIATKMTPALAVIIAALVTATAVQAGELIVGQALDANSAPLAFRIIGQNADDVVGGEIIFGDARYRIDRVSHRGMIGAVRRVTVDDAPSREFAVFSSSFSDQTAVGNPWVAARSYHHCEQPYNSFLAVYRVNDTHRLEALGRTPYATLTQDASHSSAAKVYCFVSAKGAER